MKNKTPQALPLFKYKGEQNPELHGVLYRQFANKDKKGKDWPYKADEWMFEDKTIFMATLDKQFQPMSLQHHFCSVNMGSMSNIGDVTVGDKGQGGYIWNGDQSDFEKDFEPVTKKKE